MQPFIKPALCAEDLLALLQKRGMIINDSTRAIHYINTIGYYRLSAYFLSFHKYKDQFCPGISFNDALDLYIFDRKLRLLVLDPLERIEIAIRTAISNHMSIKYGAFWFFDKLIYNSKSAYDDFIKYAQHLAGRKHKHKSISCKHYFEKYGDYELPPSWILIEELPMGCWSRLYSNLSQKQDKRSIADQFNFKWNDLKSWLEPLTILRNICAHHRRLWNSTIPIRPRNLERYVIEDAGIIDGPYLSFVVIMAFQKRFTNNPSWHINLPDLFEDCPLDPYVHMHFPPNWLRLPFWKNG